MNNKIEKIVQNYIGMTPADHGCKNWFELGEKMTNEINDLLGDGSFMVEVVKSESKLSWYSDRVGCKFRAKINGGHKDPYYKAVDYEGHFFNKTDVKVISE